MNDLAMNYEIMIRKIFQCERFNDPLGKLANTDQWIGLYSEDFSKMHVCKAWAVLSRIQQQYLDSVPDRNNFYDEVLNLEDNLLNATTNKTIIVVMNRLTEIVDELEIKEFPHITYQATNDKRKEI